MQKRALGKQGLVVSAIGLGCMGMSDFGINFLATADNYGPFTNETLIGKAIKGRRDQYIVATNPRGAGDRYPAGAMKLVNL